MCCRRSPEDDAASCVLGLVSFLLLVGVYRPRGFMQIIQLPLLNVIDASRVPTAFWHPHV